MSFARAGWPFMAGVALSAATVLGIAVWRRSWATWLLGFTLLVLAVALAWCYRVTDDERARRDDGDVALVSREVRVTGRAA